MAAHPDTIASEVLSASLGGAISASILYPLEVLKTRMQADQKQEDSDDDDDNDDKTSDGGMIEYAKQLYQKEGFRVYVNGIETSAFQSAVEKAFYFFAYTTLKNLHGTVRHMMSSNANGANNNNNKDKSMSATTNLLLGCLAEWAHLPVTLPIDCLTTAIQTSSKQNGLKLLLTILKEGDMYKGIQAYYVLCFKPAIQYTFFEQVKAAILKNRPSKTLRASEAFALGMVARTVATVAVFPFVRAKVVVQTQAKPSDPGALSVPPPSIFQVVEEMYQKGGLAALYQGLGPELTRGVFSAALMMMIKEQLNGGIKSVLYGKTPPQHHASSSFR